MIYKKNNLFEVSVIIPVYNAVKYVEEAVNSALEQSEVKEIILVWDGCNDGSLELCQDLVVKKSPIVKVLTHEDKKNHGAGASRNLGIKHANCEWISFLDADDFFLPERFKETKKAIEKFTNIDMVYETIGTYFGNHAVKKTWFKRGGSLVTGMINSPPDGKLFEAQSPIGDCGHCHLDGLTIKKEKLYRIGLFNEKLQLHQDTDLIVKLSALAKCHIGKFKNPVAMRRVHAENRITAKRTNKEKFNAKLLMWSSLISWGKENLSKSRQKLLLATMIQDLYPPIDGIQIWPFTAFSTMKQLLKIIKEIPETRNEIEIYKLLIKLIIPTKIKTYIRK